MRNELELNPLKSVCIFYECIFADKIAKKPDDVNFICFIYFTFYDAFYIKISNQFRLISLIIRIVYTYKVICIIRWLAS
jgi:hypothetical protein